MSPGGALPALDERLMAAARCFRNGCVGADIGADHGRLSCYLLARNICSHMIVSDISAKALVKAKTLLERHGLASRATFMVADGFEAIANPVGTVAVMGMGGAAISGMLARANRLGTANLVLSAHTGQPALRKALCDAGYILSGEQVVRSAGRFYTVMDARRGAADYSPRQLYIGPGLWAATAAELTAYLQWRLGVTAAERNQQTVQHLVWLKEEIQRVQSNCPDHV